MMDRYTVSYLATPYSLYPKGLDAAHIAACLLKGRLLEIGVHAYSPIAECHPVARHCRIDPLDQRFWLEHCERLMRRFDNLIVAHLDGWDSSSGMAWEIQKFTEWRKDIWDLEPLSLAMSRRENRKRPLAEVQS